MLTQTKTIVKSAQLRERPLLLIADDDSVSVAMLENIFKNHGFDIITTRDGIDCVAVATNNQPDMILLDVMMPSMDGFEVCESLNENVDTTDIPVIFLSGIIGVNSKIRGLESGAVDYITKPYHYDEVVARAKLHLRRSMEIRSLAASKESKVDQIRSAQQHLLVAPESISEAKFGVCYAPVCEAGGDYYDVAAAGEGCYAYLLSDFSGHDLGASFATPALKAIFRQNVDLLEKPNQLLNRLNSGVSPLLRRDEFMTTVYALLDRVNMRISISNAGHPPVIRVDSEGNASLIESSGDVLGAFDEVVIGHEELTVVESERFYFFTDGLFERKSLPKNSRSLALDKLISFCEMSYSLELNDSIANICELMHSELGPLEDDLVLLGCEV